MAESSTSASKKSLTVELSVADITGTELSEPFECHRVPTVNTAVVATLLKHQSPNLIQVHV